jgi:hypothetical protein
METECGAGAEKSSVRIYGFQLERHIFPALRSMPLRDINRAQIEVCLSEMKRMLRVGEI